MTEIPHREVLPMTAGMTAAGHLTIGGCDVVSLAAEFGTPLYIYDEDTIRSMCRAFVGGFKAEYPDSHVSYSSKAFSNPALARILEEERVGMDVVTGGELAIARAAEFPAGELNFHGNNKGRAELEEALDYGIGLITVDSMYEIDLLDEVARERGVTQQILLRVSPSIDGHTHLLTSTGVLDQKFGFPIETGQAEEAVRLALGKPNLDVAGVHFHLGSPIFELEPYTQAIPYVLEFVAKMREYGLEQRIFNPGGGFAIGYVPDTPPPDISEYAVAISASVREACDRFGLDEPRLIVEPGRAIVGRAGVAVYTVGGTKDIPGVRKYVSVDGGMGDNIRPALYGAEYSIVKANGLAERSTAPVTIAGKYCESGDLLVKDAVLPALEPGDVVAVAASGAYCLAMASNYNMSLRPPVVLVKDGNARLIRRRETYDDLLAASIF
ncbi:MAG: diaminopimelate decarboxylase [Chloroflexi bacterium]|nr:diaminopimelate decarboxylase [Chloroflexota bacterium]